MAPNVAFRSETSRRVYEFLKDWIAQHGSAPGRAIMAQKLKMKPNRISQVLHSFRAMKVIDYPQNDLSKLTFLRDTFTNEQRPVALLTAGSNGHGSPDTQETRKQLTTLLEQIESDAQSVRQVLAMLWLNRESCSADQSSDPREQLDVVFEHPCPHRLELLLYPF